MNFLYLICFFVLTFVRLNAGKYLLIRILKPDVPSKALPTSKQRIDSTCHDLSTWCHMLKDWECENEQTTNACRKSCGKCYEVSSAARHVCPYNPCQICKSGSPSDGGVDVIGQGHGICDAFCSQDRFCGNGPRYENDGTNCKACYDAVLAPCVPSDSDSCLQRSPLWGSSYTCNYFVRNPEKCDSDEYEKDGRRCCPDACKNLDRQYDPILYLDPHIFTKADCNNSHASSGNCDYSPQIYDEGAQCRKPGMWREIGPGKCNDYVRDNILSDGKTRDVQTCQRKCMAFKEKCAFIIFGGDQAQALKNCTVLDEHANCRQLVAWPKAVSSYEFIQGCAKVDKICTNSGVITPLNACPNCVDTWQQCGRMCQKNDKCGSWQFTVIQELRMCETFEKKDTCNEIDFGGGNRRGAWSGSSDCPQVCPKDYKLLYTPYRSPRDRRNRPQCPGDGFCCLHLSTGQCCDNINRKCDVECLKDDCHYYGGKWLQAHEIDKWLCEIPNVVDCNPATSTQWPFYKFADRCELCGDNPTQCRGACHVNRDGKCVRTWVITNDKQQFLFGPLEAYGYVLNHGAILDYIPDATPDKYCPMIKNADGTEVQDKLVIMCKKPYLELLHRLTFFSSIIIDHVPLVILRHKATDVDLANCPSTIDPNLCITGNDSAILLCSDYLNKAISYSEKVVDAYWSAFETPKDVYCGKYDDFLYGTF